MNKIYRLALIFIAVIFMGCEDKQIVQEEAKYTTNDTITVLTPNLGKKISGPIIEEAKKFEQKSGTTIRVVTPSWGDMLVKTRESFDDDKINYDIFVIISSWGGSLLPDNHIEKIPAWVKSKIDWDDVLPIYKNSVLSWNKEIFSLPYDGDCITLYYRKDIFEDRENQNKFQEKYGYMLSPPKTWKQYKDVAAFFNGWDWDNDGKIEYGVAESRLKGYGNILLFFTRAAAYAKHPGDRSYYFDADTMKPRIDNPGFVKALEEYIDIMRFAPQKVLNFSPGAVRQSFIGGEVAMVIDWANTGVMAQNSKESVVKDKVGYAQLPGADRVYDPISKKWDDRYNAPSSISGNWTILVNKNSKNKKLALEFAAHMSSKELTSELVPKGWSGINPSRFSHFENNIDKWVENGFTKESAKDYLKTISTALKNDNVMVDLRIPGSDMYYEAMGRYIDKALKKEISPKEALDQCAKEWDKITNKLEREHISRIYKASINE